MSACARGVSLPYGLGVHLTCALIEMGVAVCMATYSVYKAPDSDILSIACCLNSYKMCNHSTETFE